MSIFFKALISHKFTEKELFSLSDKLNNYEEFPHLNNFIKTYSEYFSTLEEGGWNWENNELIKISKKGFSINFKDNICIISPGIIRWKHNFLIDLKLIRTKWYEHSQGFMSPRYEFK